MFVFVKQQICSSHFYSLLLDLWECLIGLGTKQLQNWSRFRPKLTGPCTDFWVLMREEKGKVIYNPGWPFTKGGTRLLARDGSHARCSPSRLTSGLFEVHAWSPSVCRGGAGGCCISLHFSNVQATQAKAESADCCSGPPSWSSELHSCSLGLWLSLQPLLLWSREAFESGQSSGDLQNVVSEPLL